MKHLTLLRGFFFFFLHDLQLHSRIFHAFVKTDTIRVVFTVWCLVSWMLLFKMLSLLPLKIFCFQMWSKFFPVVFSFAWAIISSKIGYAFFFFRFLHWPYLKFLQQLQSNCSSAIQTQCWSFSPNVNLSMVVSLVIGSSLCMHIPTSLHSWGLQQLKIN